MTDKTIENGRKVGGNCFKLSYVRKSNKKLDFYLKQFNPEDYWILKTTNKFKFVSIKTFLDFKYSVYTFFKKDIYSREYIEEWLYFIYNKMELMINFLHKSFPPEYIKNKIKIIYKI